MNVVRWRKILGILLEHVFIQKLQQFGRPVVHSNEQGGLVRNKSLLHLMLKTNNIFVHKQLKKISILFCDVYCKDS